MRKYTYVYKERERERERERGGGRGSETDRETERQRQRERDMPSCQLILCRICTNTHIHRERERQTDRQTLSCQLILSSRHPVCLLLNYSLLSFCCFPPFSSVSCSFSFTHKHTLSLSLSWFLFLSLPPLLFLYFSLLCPPHFPSLLRARSLFPVGCHMDGLNNIDIKPHFSRAHLRLATPCISHVPFWRESQTKARL